MHLNMNTRRSHKKFSGRTRDLLSSQPGINGKGDANRTEKNENYRNNYDSIDWGKPSGTAGDAQPIQGAVSAMPPGQYSKPGFAECGVAGPRRPCC